MVDYHGMYFQDAALFARKFQGMHTLWIVHMDEEL